MFLLHSIRKLNLATPHFMEETQNRGRSFHHAFHTDKNDAAPVRSIGDIISQSSGGHASENYKDDFVTGWNEWVAGPFKRPEDKGVRLPLLTRLLRSIPGSGTNEGRAFR